MLGYPTIQVFKYTQEKLSEACEIAVAAALCFDAYISPLNPCTGDVNDFFAGSAVGVSLEFYITRARAMEVRYLPGTQEEEEGSQDGICIEGRATI